MRTSAALEKKERRPSRFGEVNSFHSYSLLLVQIFGKKYRLLRLMFHSS